MAVLKAVQGGRASEKPNSDKEDLKVFIELFEENGNINIAKLEATIEFLGNCLNSFKNQELIISSLRLYTSSSENKKNAEGINQRERTSSSERISGTLE